MEASHEKSPNGEAKEGNLQIIRYSPYHPFAKLMLPWFDIRVFYVRVSDFQVHDSTPEFLTVKHIPLRHDTLVEINGVRNGMNSEGVSSFLRSDRVDKKSDEATFVSTDSIGLTESVKFEVYDKEDCILSGVLEISNSNTYVRESRNDVKRWTMNCESEINAGCSFIKGKHVSVTELHCPKIEVYVAGCFSGTPIILTKTLQLNFRKKHNRKGMLDAIPENETSDNQKDGSPSLDLQVSQYRNIKAETEEEYNNSMYWHSNEYLDGEDGELSWFNAGVRVGVGLGLGICLGIGIGVGLLVRSYQSTTKNFKRRLI